MKRYLPILVCAAFCTSVAVFVLEMLFDSPLLLGILTPLFALAIIYFITKAEDFRKAPYYTFINGKRYWARDLNQIPGYFFAPTEKGRYDLGSM
jgi:hypothetical protein